MTKSTKSNGITFILLFLSLLIVNKKEANAFGVASNRLRTIQVHDDDNEECQNENGPRRHHVALKMAAQRRGANNSMKKAAGFSSKIENASVKEDDEQVAVVPGGQIYSLPALYDLAFGYRNFDDEVDFLMYAHQKHSYTGEAPRHVLELAAGPARHAIESLLIENSPIQTATALDFSKDMVTYGTELADRDLGVDLRSSFQYLQGDMRNFDCFSNTFDTAWILLGSLQHMTTNKDALDCFRTVHEALNSGGTLILELPHPRETFTMVECTRNGWEVPLEDGTDGELQIVWGDEDDYFDPIRQVRNFTVQMQVVGGTQDQFVKEIVPMRQYTAQEIDALANLAGFEVAGMYGALNQDVDVSDEEQAFRLVCVLHKKDK